MTGIYKIQSKIKPKMIYIGSAINYKDRKCKHLRDLRNNNHKNNKLQTHYNKYGKDDLQFLFIIGCNKENLIAYEQFYIDSLNPWFNICKVAGSSLGTRRSLEQKKKIGDKSKGRIPWNKGKKMSEEYKEKNRQCHLGFKHSEETKEKMRTRMKGNKYLLGHKFSDEYKQKMSEIKKGISVYPNGMSQETKDKISKSNKGRKLSKESKLNISKGHKGLTAWNKGKKHSKDTKEKMRVSHIGLKASKDAVENMCKAQKIAWVKRKQKSA